jgi:hypothetical protein
MKKDLTYIALVCDRSGSMSAVQSDAEGAVRNFVKEQKDHPGEAILRLVDFDAPGGFKGDDWYRTVFHGNIQSAPEYELKPRGNTALLDAVGRCITEVGEELAAMPEDERPEHVVFVVQTDGQENSSRDWQLAKLKDKIEEQTTKWKWQFVFLGMGPDTYAQGHQMGMSNVTRSADSAVAYAASYGNVSKGVSAFRSTGDVHDLSETTNVEVDSAGNVIRKDRKDEKDPT